MNMLKDNLKLRFIFLILQSILCNVLLLLAISHFITFIMYNHIPQHEFSQQYTYALMSCILLIFSFCFIYINKIFKDKYSFYKVTIAERILAENGILTAQFIRPPNIDIQPKGKLGSLNYHVNFKRINHYIDIVMLNGRILISENENLETKFYIFGRESTNVKIAKFKFEAINELGHVRNQISNIQD